MRGVVKQPFSKCKLKRFTMSELWRSTTVTHEVIFRSTFILLSVRFNFGGKVSQPDDMLGRVNYIGVQDVVLSNHKFTKVISHVPRISVD